MLTITVFALTTSLFAPLGRASSPDTVQTYRIAPAEHTGVQQLAGGTDCTGEVAVDSTTNGTNDRAYDISKRFAIWYDTPGANEVVAFEYRTYGGRTYYEYTGNVSHLLEDVPGAIYYGYATLYPAHGSMYQTLHYFLRKYHVAQYSVPYPWRTLTSSDRYIKDRCAEPRGHSVG